MKANIITKKIAGLKNDETSRLVSTDDGKYLFNHKAVDICKDTGKRTVYGDPVALFVYIDQPPNEGELGCILPNNHLFANHVFVADVSTDAIIGVPTVTGYAGVPSKYTKKIVACSDYIGRTPLVSCDFLKYWVENPVKEVRIKDVGGIVQTKNGKVTIIVSQEF